MPYIDPERRKKLDDSIAKIIISIKYLGDEENIFKNKLNNEEFSEILGDLNYCISRIISGLMSDISYPKIAMVAGLLENVKQEYYRRMATPYEKKKINQNGDIKEYLGCD